ncbi:MAG TPA: NFACT RNA binding domain-containing protein, partial [Candidatus Baltobacteraceae bacterium]|nr:NFACT RNA binding domain-containing protein [Candidatus Baltobacteraceae bacterium]
MTTDWVLIRRAALELDERLRGARVQDAGLLPDGRIALALRTRSGAIALVVDLFGSPPLVTLEDADLPIGVEPGFVRKLATTLRGMTVTAVRSRRGDRVMRLEFGTRSRFGVGDTVELILELVPRFGNAVLIKRDVVVAAAKEFTLAENPARAILAGQPYVLPPLPATIRPPLESVSDEAFSGPPVLQSFADLRAQKAGERAHRGAERRRQAIVRRLTAREQKLRAELRALEDKRREAESRDALREEGEGIFASLHELDEGQRAEAKERAAKLFARYKKLHASLEHIGLREDAVGRILDAVDVLRWEAERAADEDLDDVERAAGELEPRQSRARRTETVKRRKRKPLEFRTEAGSRIVVGRSPAENADVTFRQARPDDLWFHAQGIPGAHVVLARDDRSSPPEDDIGVAAALAAFHSKARASAKVPVDYTLRKYVRKQQDAPPGLVWYTHPKTILA